MASSKSGLGKGLGALMDFESAVPGVMQISVEKIKTNPHQPRTKFAEEDLEDLANSIIEHGVIQPLIVTKESGGDTYVLIAGERRLQASKRAKLEKVPAILREATEQEMLLLALIENVQRADLNALETAEAYRHLSESFNLTHEEIGKKVGKSRVAVTNKLSLLAVSPKVQQALVDGKITEGHARALKGLSNESQESALGTIMRKTYSVRDTEELARSLRGEREEVQEPKIPPSVNAEIEEMKTRLEEAFGTPVNIRYSQKGGRITFNYYSDEELNSLLDKLLEA